MNYFCNFAVVIILGVLVGSCSKGEFEEFNEGEVYKYDTEVFNEL